MVVTRGRFPIASWVIMEWKIFCKKAKSLRKIITSKNFLEISFVTSLNSLLKIFLPTLYILTSLKLLDSFLLWHIFDSSIFKVKVAQQCIFLPAFVGTLIFKLNVLECNCPPSIITSKKWERNHFFVENGLE